MTAVILINWNGADDTIACLESLDKAKGDFIVVVADNGSTDDSLERIRQYASGLTIKADVIALDRNWGFAAGNNRAIHYASRYNPDSYMLLNNDTVVEPDFLQRIQEYRSAHPRVKVIGPMIRYWYDKDLIWSCGGKLVFGSRKSNYRNCKVQDVKCDREMKVSFISGCALYVDASLVDKDGKLLSERFFFGEEDYEFAHRMKRMGEKMVILTDSVIYHKVGSSARKMSDRAKLGRDYIYYLGRLIVVREYYSHLSAALIRLLSRRSCRRYFMQDGLDKYQARSLLTELMMSARYKEGITYDDFRSIVIDGSFFDIV
jgi:hypothetical protein